MRSLASWIVQVSDVRLEISKVELHRSLAPVFDLRFRVHQCLYPTDVYVTRNGEIKDDGMRDRLALIDAFLVVCIISSFLAIPPRRSRIVPRLICGFEGGRGRSSASGAHPDVVIDLRNQAIRVGVCNALVGTIDEYAWGDMTDLDIGVVVNAMIASERNENSACHGRGIGATIRVVDLHSRNPNPVTAGSCDPNEHVSHGGCDREINA